MPLPRVRFTVRRLMIAVAVAAAASSCVVHFLRQPGGPDPLLLPTMATGALVSLAVCGLGLGAIFGLRALIARAEEMARVTAERRGHRLPPEASLLPVLPDPPEPE